MVSLSFAAVVCSVLFVTASALRWDNRNGPGGRRDTESGEDGSGELDQREAGPMGGKSAWGGKRGLGRGHRGGLTFLANATEEERVEFLAIFKNRTLDKASKEAAIDALMATLDPAVQEAYNTWKAEKEAALAEKIAALSPEAKAAYDARELIENDATLSTQEKWTKLREFDRSQTDAVRMELRGLRWGGGKGGFRGNRWHGSGEKQFGRKPHGFSFLANVTDPTLLDQFKAIFKNRNLDKAAKEQAIEALVATLDPAIQEAYNTWKSERDAKLAAKVAELSADAKTAYDERKAIEDNTSLSPEEKETQIRALMDELSPEVREELEEAFGGHHGGRGGDRGGRGGRGGRGRGGRGGDEGDLGRGRGFGGRFSFGNRF